MNKKFWKNWRFWLELVLSLLVIALLTIAFALGSTLTHIEQSLEKYNYVYDYEKKDIFVMRGKESEETTNSSTSKTNPKILKVGESYTFGAKDFTNSTGLKITVESVEVDKNLELNTQYSSQDYTGLIPIVVKTTFENTTNDYIDIGAFELLSSNGEMGKWVPYFEGTSTNMPDGLNSGQKVDMIQVFGSPSEHNFDLTYSGITWRVD